MSNGSPDWPSIAAVVLTAVGGIVAVVLWVPKQIMASRHKQAGDLQPMFAGIDDDIEKVDRRVDELRKDHAALDKRVAVLEAPRRRGAD